MLVPSTSTAVWTLTTSPPTSPSPGTHWETLGWEEVNVGWFCAHHPTPALLWQAAASSATEPPPRPQHGLGTFTAIPPGLFLKMVSPAAPRGLPSLFRGTARGHIHPEQHGMGLSTWGAAPQPRCAWYQVWASLLYLIHGFISSVALSHPQLYFICGVISSVALSHLGFPQASSHGLEELS